MADLAVARSGASSLTELSYFGFAGGKAQSKIASFANTPVIPNAPTSPHMIRAMH